MYNLIIVDDEPILRSGIEKFINWENIECNIVGSFENGIEAWEYISKNNVDIIISDIKMPGLDGLGLAKKVFEYNTNIKIILLTGYSDFKYAQEAIKYSVVEFILKNNPMEKIQEAAKKAIRLIEDEKRKMLLSQKFEKNLILNMNELRVKFLMDIIHNELPDEKKISERIIQLGIKEKDYSLITIKIKSIKNKANKNYYTENEAIKNFAISVLSVFEPIVFIVAQNEICIMLQNTEKWNETHINSICSKIFGAMECFGVGITIGVSNIYSKISDLRQAYNEAEYVIENGRITNNGSYIYKKPIEAAGNSYIDEIINYINENYKGELTLDSIADNFHINSSYLSRMFKKQTGENLSGYITSVRIKKSCLMLMEKNDKLANIAEKCGFGDPSYFSYIFKKYIGLSPKEYRAKNSK